MTINLPTSSHISQTALLWTLEWITVRMHDDATLYMIAQLIWGYWLGCPPPARQSTLVVSSGFNISDMLCSSWAIESIGRQTSPAPIYRAHQSDLTWRLPLLALRQTAGEGSFQEDDEQIVCWYSLHHARWHLYIYNTFHVAVSAWVQKGNVDFGTISCKWRSTYNSMSLVSMISRPTRFIRERRK